MKCYAQDLKFTIDGVEYTWMGAFGCLFDSHENGVKRNDIRMIGGEVFYAYMVDNCGWKRRVSWLPQEELTAEKVDEYKRAIFQ